MSDPQHALQLVNEGWALHATGQLAPAVARYRAALAIDSQNAEAFLYLGMALHQMGQHEQGKELVRRAAALAPDNADVHANFAELWRMEGQWAPQLECLQRALALRPDDALRREQYGEALAKLGDDSQAIEEYQKVMQSGRQTAQTWLLLGASLRQLDRFDEALAATFRAAELEPHSENSWHHLAWSLVQMGRPREAIPHLNRALALAPNRALLVWRRAWIGLVLGDYPQGWRDYEARWLDKELQGGRQPNYPGPAWRGQDVTGKTVYVHREQGMGDTLQFCRYLPLMAARGAARVVAQCQAPLLSLLARSMPRIQWLPDEPVKVAYDFHVAMGSLPLAFGTTLSTIPAQVPYLASDPAKVEMWRGRLAALPGKKVGLAWSGSMEFAGNRFRSPPLAKFSLLGEMAEVTLVSLQKGPPAAQAFSSSEIKLIDWTAELNSFDDTAALASALDLIVTVDTSVAHLAGALGLPAWILLGAGADFRWLLDREDSPWYPTIRLFRQATIGDWEPPIRKIADELRRFVSK